MTHRIGEPRGHRAMLRLFALLLVFATAALSGCDQAALFDSLIPKEEAQQAQGFVAKLAAHDFAAIEAAMVPEFQSAELPAQLEAMARIMPAGAPKAVRTVGSNTVKTPDVTTYNFLLEYEYPDAWLMATVVLERREDKLFLKGIHFAPRGQSLEAENHFSLDGKGWLHYVVLACAVAVPLFIVYALVLCVRTKFPRRKWLWVLFVAVGLVQFHFNWSSGDLQVQPVAFQLLGAGFFKSGPVAPWMFTVSIPVGAIVFLLRRRQLRLEAAGAAPAAVAADPGPRPN